MFRRKKNKTKPPTGPPVDTPDHGLSLISERLPAGIVMHKESGSDKSKKKREKK